MTDCARRENIVAGGCRFTICPDNEVPSGGLVRAVVEARVMDEITKEPPKNTVCLLADRQGLVSCVGGGGSAGVAGVPSIVFSALGNQDSTFKITVIAERYIRRTVNITMRHNAQFPNSFQPGDCGAIVLHREPVVINGRVVSDNGVGRIPIPNATVKITGIWLNPPADTSVPAGQPNLLSLRPTLYSERIAGVGKLRRIDLPPVAGEDKFLLDDVPPGKDTVRLSDGQNLSNGDILLIDADNPDISEYLQIADISSSSEAAYIELLYPVAHSHRGSAVVKKTNPHPAGSDVSLSRECIVDDTCVLLTDISGVPGAAIVRISGGPNPPEYHKARKFMASTNADGYFRLPPLSRVARIEIEATDGGMPPKTLTRTFCPNYEEMENRVDIVFTKQI